jgi:hypothetical protein
MMEELSKFLLVIGRTLSKLAQDLTTDPVDAL